MIPAAAVKIMQGLHWIRAKANKEKNNERRDDSGYPFYHKDWGHKRMDIVGRQDSLN